jgi:Ala-tRNA(Pro) deacylase
MTVANPVSRPELMAFFQVHGIATSTVEHEAVFTVEESEKLHRDIAGAHTKNLFLKDAKDQLFLVIAEAHARIDLKALPKTLGCGRLSFGKPELMLATLGIAPGSVTAFAVINDRSGRVQVVIDQTLMASATINCHPLTNTATTSIARDDLLVFLRATGHEPRIERLPVAPA